MDKKKATITTGSLNHTHLNDTTIGRLKSTDSATQRTFVLERLIERPYTTNELRNLGIFCPSPRIFELRKIGHRIETIRTSVYDDAGIKHNGVAKYVYITGGIVANKKGAEL